MIVGVIVIIVSLAFVIRDLCAGKGYMRVFEVCDTPVDLRFYLYKMLPPIYAAIFNPRYWLLWTGKQWIAYAEAHYDYFSLPKRSRELIEEVMQQQDAD